MILKWSPVSVGSLCRYSRYESSTGAAVANHITSLDVHIVQFDRQITPHSHAFLVDLRGSLTTTVHHEVSLAWCSELQGRHHSTGEGLLTTGTQHLGIDRGWVGKLYIDSWASRANKGLIGPKLVPYWLPELCCLGVDAGVISGTLKQTRRVAHKI